MTTKMEIITNDGVDTVHDYRAEILAYCGRVAVIGDDWESSLFTGSPLHIDRAEAERLADWLDIEAGAEWGADHRHHEIAAFIRAAIASATA